MKEDHRDLIDSMTETPTVHKLLNLTLTLDQAKVVLTMLDSLKSCSQNLESSELSM